MKGRKAIPIDIKRAKGTLRNHRIKSVPEPSSHKPYPPSWLNKRAKQIFWHMCGRLNEIGLATRTHTEAIALLSSRMDEVERFDKTLNDQGYTYEITNPAGDQIIREHPAAKLRERAARHVHSLLCEFGLTPAAVQKVGKAVNKKTTNEFSDF